MRTRGGTPPGLDRPRRRGGRTAPAAALLLALALVAAACGSGSGSSSNTTAPTIAAPTDQAVYEGPGPYVPGTTTLDLDGRKVEVWYPADPGTETGKTKDLFDITTILPDAVKSLVPPELNPLYETPAYRGLPVSAKGPWPLVLFAHGFAAYPTMYTGILSHLASWGFVVAAPDFNERGLFAALTGLASSSAGATGNRIDESAVFGQTLALMTAQSATSGSPFEGKVDTRNVATMGHSAGVTPTLGFATDPAVKTFIAMSGGTTLDASKVPNKPGMVMSGGKDQIATIDRVRGLYDSMATPKRLVVVDEAGHLEFTDICLVGADKGGLLAIAAKVGLQVPELLARLFNDGCTPEFLPTAQAQPAEYHFTVAQLRWSMGIDPEPVGLGPGVVASFLPTKVTYEQSL